MATKKTILVLGIAIITLIVFVYGMQTFYPDINCYPERFIDTNLDCTAEGGIWNEEFEAGPRIITGEKNVGWCDFEEKCFPIRNERDRNVALISFLIGGAIFMYGLKGKKLVEQTTTGLLGGGLLIIGYGITVYWTQFNEELRFVVLLGLLIALIWIGNKYKKNFK